ncbi:MAG: hypothetical protein AUG88_01020 [Actinobacteria bacterium 13_1_20CM_4_68_12]|nr:MAG: hypothetical protein AUG88_01020 [Actinobacteria bacterium 13_1_20CM_4_68_12]
MREGRRERVHRIGGEPDDRDDQQKRGQLRPLSQEAKTVPHARLLAGRPLLPARPNDKERRDEDPVRGRVEREGGRDPEVVHRQRRTSGPERAGQVEGHRVQRHGRGHLVPPHERDDQRLLRRRREGADDAEAERVGDHDPRCREASPRQRREPGRQHDGEALGDQQQLAAVEPVGEAPGPRRQHQDRDELGEAEDAEQQRRVRQPVDQQRRGEVLEPRPARRERVADEVRSEIAPPDDPPDRPRTGYPLVSIFHRRPGHGAITTRAGRDDA